MSDENPHSFNEGVIQDFREHNGKVGPPFEGAPLLLLTTTGRRSGQPRVTPLVFGTDAGRILIYGSYAGADEHPAWFLNLVDNPRVVVETGDGASIDTFEATATQIEGAERDRLFAEQKARMPGFGDYEAKTSRVIPVIALDRTA